MGCNFMVDNSPKNSKNSPIKRNNPFKKILEDVKKFIKKDGENDKKPSSVAISKKEKNKEQNIQPRNSNIKSENSNKKSGAPNKKSKRANRRQNNSNKQTETSNKQSENLNEQSDISGLPIIQTPETKAAERSERARKANAKEQKLPKKYKKGW
jgi:hypothetical protein